MGIGTGTAAIIGGLGVAGGVGSALIGSHAAGKAADTQANSANYAATLQKQAADEALAFQKQQYNQNQQNIAPWLSTGRNALGSLGYLLGVNPQTNTNSAVNNPAVPGSMDSSTAALVAPSGTTSLDTLSGKQYQMSADNTNDVLSNPYLRTSVTGDNAGATGTGDVGATTTTEASDPNAPFVNSNLGQYGSLLAPWTQQFTAPTDVTEQNDPGFQFRLQQGEKAIQASAAAHGSLLTGGTAKALSRYGQDYASNEYNNVYNRSLGEYQQKYNTFRQNQTDQYNKLANIAGLGQTAAGQLSSAGQNSANNVSNILLGSANSIGNSLQNAGAARASGYVGSANAISGGLQSGLGSIGSYLTLASLLGNQNGSGGGWTPPTWAGTGLGG